MSDSLKQMLSDLEPLLRPDEYVFCCVEVSSSPSFERLQPIATFHEAEGFTVVVERQRAELAKLSFSSVFRCITLGLHSDLEAVGLTAAVSTALAEQQISANVIAAYHHDHIFVPAHRAQEALLILRRLSAAT